MNPEREGLGNSEDTSPTSKGFAVSLGRQPGRRHWKVQVWGISALQETTEAWWLREALAEHSGQGNSFGDVSDMVGRGPAGGEV